MLLTLSHIYEEFAHILNGCEGKMRGHLLFAALLIALSSIGCAQAATIYVPDNYTKIQWAVDNATAGDTIIVRDGIYYESITVSKQLTIKSENGSANCIVKGGGSDVFTLEADGIRIEGFTITGGNDDGIYLNYSNNNTIINNNISSNEDDGIYLRYSNNNSISNNNISSNDCDGIDLYKSNNNIISNNNIRSNDNDGIALYSSNNNILNNSISNNWCGIHLCKSNNNISNNNISSNYYGILLEFSSNNSISNNNISSNGDYGIYLIYWSNDNSISYNNISNNGYGIYLGYWSDNNIIYLNNFIDNTDNVYSEYSTNIWNSTEKITYTYKGSTFTNYTGNYWDDYTGNDTNGDGIGDTPYSIGLDKDNYPLMERFENYFAPAPTPTPTPTPTLTPTPTPSIPEFPAYSLLIAASCMIALAFMISRRGGRNKQRA